MLIFIILSYFSLSTDGLSTKKGLCVQPNVFRCGDLDGFTNFTWWYDYTRQAQHMRECPPKPQHVPMVWGTWFEPEDVEAIKGGVILGFNEPNYIAQANMSPEEAAERWKVLEAAATTERKLVSPSAANCKGSSKCNMKKAKEWFEQFFSACKDCRIDYLATHAYHCNATKSMKYLKSLWKKYNKPIWLTAFACGGKYDYKEDQLQYMKEMLPLLEEADYIYRYAWFATDHTSETVPLSSELLEWSGSTRVLSELGQYYNDF